MGGRDRQWRASVVNGDSISIHRDCQAGLAAVRWAVIISRRRFPRWQRGNDQQRRKGTMELKLESRALKASVVLDPVVLAGVIVPNGLAKVTLRVAVPEKTIVAEVNAKTLRRTIAAINAAGPDAVAVVLQGRLESGNILAEAGIAAQLKTPKAAAA